MPYSGKWHPLFCLPISLTIANCLKHDKWSTRYFIYTELHRRYIHIIEYFLNMSQLRPHSFINTFSLLSIEHSSRYMLKKWYGNN